MTDGARRGDETVATLAALLVVSLAFRPQISAIGPLVPAMREELGSSFALLGLLTTIPVLCMGLFAPSGPWLARRLGLARAIAASGIAVIAFGIARAVAPGLEWIVALTVGIGIGTALPGPLLPMVVRERLPGRLVPGTSAYAAGTVFGAVLGTGLAVPLAVALGGWRMALVALAVGSLGSVATWWIASRNTSRAVGSPGARPGHATPLPWRRPIAWVIGGLSGMQSWLYYGATAWLAVVYVERGWPAADAGLLVGELNLAILAGTLAAPLVGQVLRVRREQLALAAITSTFALIGIALIPIGAVAWAALLGLGLGTSFTLVLALPTDVSDEPGSVGGMASFMLLVGYVVAAFAPFALGALRDVTGSFASSLWLLVGVAATMAAGAWTLRPHRLRPPIA